MASRDVSRSDGGLSGARGPGVLLALAAAIVGVAIALDDGAARAVNGVGVLLWIAAAALLVRSVRGSVRWQTSAFVVVAIVLVLALLVRPSDLVAAAAGFSVAGVIIALVVRDRTLGWALLVPAGWLPAHVSLAIGRSLLSGGAAIRTDPPPTAALVPLMMVVAATVGAVVVVRWRGGRDGLQPTPGHAD